MKEKLISSKIVYEGKIIKVRQDEVLTANEQLAIREVTGFDVKIVAILPIVNNKVVLIRQYRHAVSQILYEIPAGRMNKQEDIEVAAIRELKEETGYSATSVKSLGKIFPTPGISNEEIHLFYVDNDLVKGETDFDIDEMIESEHKSIDEVLKMIDEGLIQDSKTISAIYKYLYRTNGKICN